MKIRVYGIADGLYVLPQDMLIPQLRQQLSYILTIFGDNYEWPRRKSTSFQRKRIMLPPELRLPESRVPSVRARLVASA